jgi:hypothetical protein
MYGGGTSETFVHGGDTTLTRAHVEEVQRGRLKRGLDPLTADALVVLFVRFPQPRHFTRAYELMRPRGATRAGEAK